MEEIAAAVVEEQAKAQAEAQAQKTEGTDLNIQDLVGLKSIIDVATQRGAFKAAEMEAVGKLYNRLNGFIESVTKTKEQ
jgi:hypothetical protein